MLFQRIKAAVIDVALIMLVIFLFDFAFNNLPFASNTPKAIALFLLFFIYDPALTAFSGGTVGHHVMRLRVKRQKDQDRNISFPAALVRFFFKTILGWLSLLTIAFTDRSQAVHDMVVFSVVVYKV